MNVTPTGIIFYGVCQIASEHCNAREGGVVTAVRTAPIDGQVNVCKTCLDEQIRNRLWHIEGAYVPNMRHLLDLAVVDSSGKVVIGVEVKNKKTINQQSATQLATQLIAREKMSSIPFFFLVTPEYCYTWKVVDGSLNDAKMIKLDSYIPKIYGQLGMVLDDAKMDASHAVQKSSSSLAKEHMLLERASKHLLEDEDFIHSLPKEISEHFENSKVCMEYVLPNA